MWSVLRDRRLEGYKFRRQQPLGSYIVDFICLSHRLIVEIDGGQHAMQVVRDEGRTAWLEDQGFRVIRFWNNQVLEELEGVRESILNEIKSLEAPSP